MAETKRVTISSEILRQFGNTWIDLGNIDAIEFVEGDDAECRFKGADDVWYIPEDDAALIKTFLESQAK